MLKKILKLVSEEEIISQRKISKYLNISLGSVNKYLAMSQQTVDK